MLRYYSGGEKAEKMIIIICREKSLECSTVPSLGVRLHSISHHLLTNLFVFGQKCVQYFITVIVTILPGEYSDCEVGTHPGWDPGTSQGCHSHT